MQKVLVFDLYNTLVEITRPTMPLMQLYRQHIDMSAQQFRRKVLTQPLETIWMMPFIKQSKIDRQSIGVQLQQEIASVQVFPETIPVLNELSQYYTLYLISNLATPYIQPYRELNLDRFFERAIFSCEVGSVKPEQAIFDLVPWQPGDKVTMIGDSGRADIQGAQAMGWQYWWVQRKQAFDPEKRIIASLSDLLKPAAML
ncbi:HAD family hydrolase [Microscilla marina]|uniref:Hydrolase, HAD superfamily, putative n=1 Tax=Microscilla marina ATCC 23134 TaxID=313606 RepID=A1ZW73_MICM2|nr:HAD family hydrolase [Microscilla marina]EAY25436.1 hydrolase, HAD superfamily, putative [Microscilla marina ATCC 23134]